MTKGVIFLIMALFYGGKIVMNELKEIRDANQYTQEPDEKLGRRIRELVNAGRKIRNSKES